MVWKETFAKRSSFCVTLHANEPTKTMIAATAKKHFLNKSQRIWIYIHLSVVSNNLTNWQGNIETSDLYPVFILKEVFGGGREGAQIGREPGRWWGLLLDMKTNDWLLRWLKSEKQISFPCMRAAAAPTPTPLPAAPAPYCPRASIPATCRGASPEITVHVAILPNDYVCTLDWPLRT